MKFRARFLGKLLLIPVVVAAAGWVFMTLWNLVVPDIFMGARPIDYWHGVGLLVLSRFLFGRFSGRHAGGHKRWDKWAAMTSEEREQLRKGWPGRGKQEEQA